MLVFRRDEHESDNGMKKRVKQAKPAKLMHGNWWAEHELEDWGLKVIAMERDRLDQLHETEPSALYLSEHKGKVEAISTWWRRSSSISCLNGRNVKKDEMNRTKIERMKISPQPKTSSCFCFIKSRQSCPVRSAYSLVELRWAISSGERETGKCISVPFSFQLPIILKWILNFVSRSLTEVTVYESDEKVQLHLAV